MPPEGGVVRLTTGRFPNGEGQYIRVSDNGRGIDPDLMPRIFEPFVTSKPVGQGTGLGLSIAAEIMELHGGTLEAVNNDQGGATFTMILPPS